MKKFLILVAVAVFAVGMASTANAEMQLEIGAKGGLNLGDMWGDDTDSLGTETSFRTGFIGGAFLGAQFNESFGARLELLYAQRGQKVDIDLGGTTEELTFALDYIEIALYGVGTFPVNETVSIHGFAGPYMGFNSTAEVTNGGTEDISDFIASTDFGLGVGAGVGFMASEMLKIFVEGQYNIGLISVDDSDDDLTINNNGIAFTAGVAIPLSGGSSDGM